MNTMMIMMIVMIALSAFVLPAALVIYWVLGSVFTIIQTTIFSLDCVKAKLKSLSNRKKQAKVIK
jgi:membrane protein insertase Oxa1/YidC/SpoIIIJ